MKTVMLKIQRFDPEKDQRPHWVEYQVAVEANDRLLDALHKIKWEQDGSLTFRRSCGHGVCGSDAMSVSGLNHLACKLLMGRLPNKITIMPLLAFRVIKDLVVDMDPFFAQYEKIKPLQKGVIIRTITHARANAFSVET
jgi:succinate dehydrogenase / fumarate reductase iron-sulfur subunit